MSKPILKESIKSLARPSTYSLLGAIVIVAILALHANGQDAYINGHQWHGHEVDLCYLDFEKIRDQGDPEGSFAYAKLHLKTMTHFEYGEPVFLLRKKTVQPDDVTLALVRRVGESTLYWTDPEALGSVDPFAKDKADAKAAFLQDAHQKAERTREQFKLEAKRMHKAWAAAEDPHARPPIALQRYWQIGDERLRGKLLNANATHAKILKSSGETSIVDRRHLSETSNNYVFGMLDDLRVFREYQAMITRDREYLAMIARDRLFQGAEVPAAP
jgi:hypothetical protein